VAAFNRWAHEAHRPQHQSSPGNLRPSIAVAYRADCERRQCRHRRCNAADVVWKIPAPNVRAKSPNEVKQQWPAWSLLGPTDIVFTNATAKDGDKGSCATAVQTTVAQLSGSTPAPTPPPAPSPTIPSSCLTTGCSITWQAPTLNDDGSPIKPILKYLLSVNGIIQDVGPVLAYTLIKPVGDYTLSLQTVTADGMSGPTKSAVAHVVAPVVTPPPIPPAVITVESAPSWVLKKGTSNVQAGLADYPACKKAAEVLATKTLTKYSCIGTTALTVKLP